MKKYGVLTCVCSIFGLWGNVFSSNTSSENKETGIVTIAEVSEDVANQQLRIVNTHIVSSYHKQKSSEFKRYFTEFSASAKEVYPPLAVNKRYRLLPALDTSVIVVNTTVYPIKVSALLFGSQAVVVQERPDFWCNLGGNWAYCTTLRKINAGQSVKITFPVYRKLFGSDAVHDVWYMYTAAFLRVRAAYGNGQKSNACRNKKIKFKKVPVNESKYMIRIREMVQAAGEEYKLRKFN